MSRNLRFTKGHAQGQIGIIASSMKRWADTGGMERDVQGSVSEAFATARQKTQAAGHSTNEVLKARESQRHPCFAILNFRAINFDTTVLGCCELK